VEIGVSKTNESEEYWFEEGCYIIEIANDPGDESLSIARARVKPGTSTKAHMLDGVAERYIIIEGTGRVEVGDTFVETVGQGDVVRIPPYTCQKITNLGDVDLLFYVICTPRFSHDCYRNVQEEKE